ncbi:lipase member M-like [Nylanderia fulva]|uniref:lipase member M-like n=1 Tax=Nylanderia fulva TaxID=613905 RepID=UPI0010FB0573|nr:lipase member M-like [Nylanderia fulva]
MRLLGIICLLSFYGCLNAASMSPEVTFEPSTFIRRIRGTTWNWLNNTKFNSNILSTPEMIKKKGYPAESAYVIMTEDGYLLTLHRIPGGNDFLPVLLQYGLLSSSADWLALGKNKALRMTI